VGTFRRCDSVDDWSFRRPRFDGCSGWTTGLSEPVLYCRTQVQRVASLLPMSHLARATELDHRLRLVVWPGAGEGYLLKASPPERPAVRGSRIWESSGKDVRDSARRATNEMRRYAVHNHLVEQLVLTWKPGGEREPDLSTEVRNYLRRLQRAGVVDHPSPYVWVAEKATQLHVHMLLPHVNLAAAKAAWRCGRTEANTLDGTVGIRTFANYLGKDFHTAEPLRHRYRAAQGFAPERICIPVDSADHGVRAAGDLVGSGVVSRWGPSGSPVIVRLEWPVDA